MSKYLILYFSYRLLPQPSFATQKFELQCYKVRSNTKIDNLRKQSFYFIFFLKYPEKKIIFLIVLLISFSL